jgi:hypothetical protein
MGGIIYRDILGFDLGIGAGCKGDGEVNRVYSRAVVNEKRIPFFTINYTVVLEIP